MGSDFYFWYYIRILIARNSKRRGAKRSPPFALFGRIDSLGGCCLFSFLLLFAFLGLNKFQDVMQEAGGECFDLVLRNIPCASFHKASRHHFYDSFIYLLYCIHLVDCVGCCLLPYATGGAYFNSFHLYIAVRASLCLQLYT